MRTHHASEHGLHLGHMRVASITFTHKWCPVLSFTADTDCLAVKITNGNNSKKEENDCSAWRTENNKDNISHDGNDCPTDRNFSKAGDPGCC